MSEVKKRRVSAAERAIEVAEKRAREKLLVALAGWMPFRLALNELVASPLFDVDAARELSLQLRKRVAAEVGEEEPEVVQ